MESKQFQPRSTSISAWFRANKQLLFLTLALFLSNQILDRILVAFFAQTDPQICRLDCLWYSGIANQGYSDSGGTIPDYTLKQNWAFFPLFPLVIAAANGILHTHPYTATVLTSKLCFLVAIYLFLKLASQYLGPINPIIPGLVVTFNPYSIYANAGYTEPLFLALTSLFFLQLCRNQILTASLTGLLLASTRLPGLTALPAMGTQLWLNRKNSRREAWPASLLALAIIPIGFLLFAAHLHSKTGDPLAFIHIQTAWRGSAASLHPFGWINSLSRGLLDRSLWLYPYWAVSGIIVLISSLFFLIRPGRKADRFRPLAMFSLVSTLLPLTSDCWGLTRYIWWQAPVLLAVTGLLTKGRPIVNTLAWLTLAIATTLLCYSQWFTSRGWYMA